MTAVSDIENKVKAFSLGAVDYITKPFQEDEVLARVKTHIKLYSLTKDLENQIQQRTQTTLKSIRNFATISNEACTKRENVCAWTSRRGSRS